MIKFLKAVLTSLYSILIILSGLNVFTLITQTKIIDDWRLQQALGKKFAFIIEIYLFFICCIPFLIAALLIKRWIRRKELKALIQSFDNNQS